MSETATIADDGAPSRRIGSGACRTQRRRRCLSACGRGDAAGRRIVSPHAISGDGAVADAMLLDRLGLKAATRCASANRGRWIGGILDYEPDAVADRMTYGPRIFVSLATLEKTDLDQAWHADPLALCDQTSLVRHASDRQAPSPNCGRAFRAKTTRRRLHERRTGSIPLRKSRGCWSGCGSS